MSSGEVASLRILATLGTVRVLFKVDDLAGLDAEGQRLVRCRRWNWSQARRTQLREDTTAALFILDALDR